MGRHLGWLEDGSKRAWKLEFFHSTLCFAWLIEATSVAYYWTIVDRKVRRAPTINTAKDAAVALVLTQVSEIADLLSEDKQRGQ